jgi:hypothetical protein
VFATLFSGGIISAVYTLDNFSCNIGGFAGTSCVISNFPTNVDATSCAFFFQVQLPGTQTACVPISVSSYSVISQSGTDLTLGIFVSVASGGSGSIDIANISILIVNPAYTAVAN